MAGKFSNKIAQGLLAVLMFAIMISFALTGFQGSLDFVGSSGPKAGKVNGKDISLREYSAVLNNRLEFYRNMLGGKDLTNTQIEQFGIKQMVLKSLIEKKLLEDLADKSNISFSDKSLAKTIKELPYFKSGDQFDVNLYKNILRQNGMNPSQFEEQIAADEKVRILDQFLNQLYLISNNFAIDAKKIEENFITVDAIQLSKESLRNRLPVSAARINDFLKEEKNLNRIQADFDRNKARWNKPAEVKARHILIKVAEGDEKQALKKINEIKAKVTPSNFKQIANKETEDPSGKNNGGDLGWFSKGRMVKEFEQVAFNLNKGQISQPVKTNFGYHLIYLEDKKAAQKTEFDQAKRDIAKELIQKSMNDELNKEFETVNEKIVSLLKSNNTKALEKLETELGFNWAKDGKINQLSKNIGSIAALESQIKEVFADKKIGAIKQLGDQSQAKIVYIKSINQTPKASFEPSEIKAEVEKLNGEISRNLREELMKELESKAKIVTYPGII
jgi:peptidyl-prolyl cis-trans isomerase D